MEESHKYDDIIHLSRPASPGRPRMSAVDRGTQFSPFAALSGYEEAVRETARLTDTYTELTEDEKSALDGKLRLIAEQGGDQVITVTYFLPDKRKAGGEYVSVTGAVREIDAHERCVRMELGEAIPIDQIRAIEGEIFDNMNIE